MCMFISDLLIVAIAIISRRDWLGAQLFLTVFLMQKYFSGGLVKVLYNLSDFSLKLVVIAKIMFFVLKAVDTIGNYSK